MVQDNSCLEFEIFEHILREKDGATHHLFFQDTFRRYAVPVCVTIEPTRAAVAIVASTPKPVPSPMITAAEFFAAHASMFGDIPVLFDESSLSLSAYKMSLVSDLDWYDPFYNAVWDT